LELQESLGFGREVWKMGSVGGIYIHILDFSHDDLIDDESFIVHSSLRDM
jgi:hypothetical protein